MELRSISWVLQLITVNCATVFIILIEITTRFTTCAQNYPTLSCLEVVNEKLTSMHLKCNIASDVISCHHKPNACTQLEYSSAEVNATFTVLESITLKNRTNKENITFCIGMQSWNVDTHENSIHRITFASNFSVGVIVAERSCWMQRGANCTREILIRTDIASLPPIMVTPNWLEFWNFSSALLRADLGWPETLYVEGERISEYGFTVLGLAGSAFRQFSLNGYFGEDPNGPVPAIHDMPRLRILDISNNLMSEFKSGRLNGTHNIEHFRLRGNSFNETPNCIEVLSKLSTLSIESNTVNLTLTPHVFTNLKYLKSLSISNTPIMFPATEFSIMAALKEMSLTRCRLEIFKSMLFHIPILEFLDLSQNLISHISEDSFNRFPLLKSLDLSGNQITKIEENTFRTLRNLRTVNLESNFLTFWPKFFNIRADKIILSNNQLNHLVNLGENSSYVYYLDVSRNNISQWEDRNIFVMPKLSSINIDKVERRWEIGTNAPGNSLLGDNKWIQSLNISRNIIQEFSEVMLDSLSTLNEVDLGGNVIDCSSCRMPALQRWLNVTNATKIDVYGKRSALKCGLPLNLEGLPVQGIQFDEEVCRDPRVRWWWGLGLPLCATVVVIALITAIAVHYRTEVAYLMHLAKIRSTSKGRERDINGCIYDAFVCYSGTNRKWVLRRLTRLLERPPESYRLCLFDRDFRLGTHIVTNIVESIDQSSKVIVVLTEHFIASKWCQWELEMANHKLFGEDREFLVLLELEPLERRRLPRLLRFLLTTRPVVRWPQPETRPRVLQAGAELRTALGPSLRQRKNCRNGTLVDEHGTPTSGGGGEPTPQDEHGTPTSGGGGEPTPQDEPGISGSGLDERPLLFSAGETC